MSSWFLHNPPSLASDEKETKKKEKKEKKVKKEKKEKKDKKVNKHEDADAHTLEAMKLLTEHVQGVQQVQQSAAIGLFVSERLPSTEDLLQASSDTSPEGVAKSARAEAYALLAAKVAQLEKSTRYSSAEIAQEVATRLPGAHKGKGRLETISTYGFHILGFLEDNSIKHALPFLSSGLLGKDAHADRLQHDSTVDWLDKAGAARFADRAADLVHRCVFVSVSGPCSLDRREHMLRLMDEAHADNASLESFLRFTTLPLRGTHSVQNPDAHLVMRMHLCYDTYEVWSWLERQGLKLPAGGLNALVHGTTHELESSLPGLSRLSNPAHIDRNVCHAGASANFQALKEPKEVTAVELEEWLRGVLACLYVELLGIAAEEDAFVCEREVGVLRGLLEDREPQDAFRSVHAQIVGRRGGTSRGRRAALLLYYLYGPEQACASFQWLYPHGEELRDFVHDIAGLRDHLSAQAARKHMKWAVSRLAHAAVTKLGRQAGAHAALHYTRKAVRTAVRSAVRLGSLLSQAAFWISALKPLFCLLGLAASFYGGFANQSTMDILNAMGMFRSIVHVLLGDLAGQTMLRISDLYNVVTSMKDGTGITQIIYIFLKLLDYAKLFLDQFLPGCSVLWNQFIAISDATQQAGLASSAAQRLVGGLFGDAATSIYNAASITRVAAAMANVVALPLEAFGRLGVHVAKAAQYASGGENSPFYVNVLVMIYMAWRGNYSMIVLKLLEYSCTTYQEGEDAKRECRERVAGYRKLYNMLVAVDFLYKAVFGELLFDFCEKTLGPLLLSPLSSSFQTLCIGEIAEVSKEEMRFQTLKDIGLSDEETKEHMLTDLTEEEVTGFYLKDLENSDPNWQAKFFRKGTVFTEKKKAQLIKEELKEKYAAYRKYRDFEKAYIQAFVNHNTEVTLAKYEYSWQNLLLQHKDFSLDHSSSSFLQRQLQEARALLRDAAFQYEKELEEFKIKLDWLGKKRSANLKFTAADMENMKKEYYRTLPLSEQKLIKDLTEMTVTRVTGSETLGTLAGQTKELAGDAANALGSVNERMKRMFQQPESEFKTYSERADEFGDDARKWGEGHAKAMRQERSKREKSPRVPRNALAHISKLGPLRSMTMLEASKTAGAVRQARDEKRIETEQRVEAEKLAKWKTDNFKGLMEKRIEAERSAAAKQEAHRRNTAVALYGHDDKIILEESVKAYQKAKEEARRLEQIAKEEKRLADERKRTAVVPYGDTDKSTLKKSMKAYEEKVIQAKKERIRKEDEDFARLLKEKGVFLGVLHHIWRG